MINVILLTGFLGSGKTTCLNQLLPRLARANKRVAVVMNEFGSVGVDGKLIDGVVRPVELQNGSIFCVCIRDNFLAAMAKLAEELKPEIVVIEATGVADPFEMGDFLAYPGLLGIYRLYRTVTLVDAINFPKVIQTLRAARAQAEAADVFVITKTDLVDWEGSVDLGNLLVQLNPTALQIVAPFCRLSGTEWELVLGLTQAVAAGRQYSVRQPARDPIVSVTLSIGPFADITSAREAIARALPPNTLRAKGFIDISGRPHLFQYTMGKAEVTDVNGRVEKTGQLVVIGLNLRRDQIPL